MSSASILSPLNFLTTPSYDFDKVLTPNNLVIPTGTTNIKVTLKLDFSSDWWSKTDGINSLNIQLNDNVIILYNMYSICIRSGQRTRCAFVEINETDTVELDIDVMNNKATIETPKGSMTFNTDPIQLPISLFGGYIEAPPQLFLSPVKKATITTFTIGYSTTSSTTESSKDTDVEEILLIGGGALLIIVLIIILFMVIRR